MKLTPLDIQQQKFEVKWRGYDRQEVETFLEMVSEDVESLLKEHNELRDVLQKYEVQLADFRENERAIQQTIMTTQKVSDDLKRNAQREAELIISEAKVEAEKISNDAKTQAEKILGNSREEIENKRSEINDLRNRKLECELSFKNMLESQLRLLKSEVEGKE
ncbi:MAG: DivIVA domain-containing protein [Deltaproteobacteria bacterium]|nr:DivIVA domain-containing protein [Deltaproteobacteria bacterium]